MIWNICYRCGGLLPSIAEFCPHCKAKVDYPPVTASNRTEAVPGAIPGASVGTRYLTDAKTEEAGMGDKQKSGIAWRPIECNGGNECPHHKV